MYTNKQRRSISRFDDGILCWFLIQRRNFPVHKCNVIYRTSILIRSELTYLSSRTKIKYFWDFWLWGWNKKFTAWVAFKLKVLHSTPKKHWYALQSFFFLGCWGGKLKVFLFGLCRLSARGKFHRFLVSYVKQFFGHCWKNPARHWVILISRNFVWFNFSLLLLLNDRPALRRDFDSAATAEK